MKVVVFICGMFLLPLFTFGQDVSLLNSRFRTFDKARDSVPSFFRVEKKMGNKIKSKTYNMDSVVIKEVTSIKDANGFELFTTTLEFNNNGILKSKSDFNAQTKISETKYFYESGQIRTDQKTEFFEITESTSYDENGNIVPAMLDNVASARGGVKGWNEYLSKELVYPKSARKSGEEGTVYITFIVNEIGKIAEVNCVNDRYISPDLVEEALRVMKAYPYYWTPATFNGKTVEQYMRIPIRFSLSD
jgi:TonB family protein